MTLVILWFYLQLHYEVDICGSACDILKWKVTSQKGWELLR